MGITTLNNKSLKQNGDFVNIDGSPVVNGAGKHRWDAESATEATGLLRGKRRGLLKVALASLYSWGVALVAIGCHYKDCIALTFLGTKKSQNEAKHLLYINRYNYAKT